MADKPALTISYSVLAEGLSNIVLPEPRPDTEILVIVQGEGGTVPLRDDLRVIRLDSRGVTRSRNEAIRRARGEVLVFGEENVTWIREGLDEVIENFADNPRMAVMLGRANDENDLEFRPRRDNRVGRSPSRPAQSRSVLRRELRGGNRELPRGRVHPGRRRESRRAEVRLFPCHLQRSPA